MRWWEESSDVRMGEIRTGDDDIMVAGDGER